MFWDFTVRTEKKTTSKVLQFTCVCVCDRGEQGTT